ncbi:MAG: carboxypeptidase-like regulatory domain-containing protein, partial [Bacteroidetes bacterium]
MRPTAFITGLLLALSALRTLAGSVDGKVTDEDGEPVPFVSVYIEGTTLGTTTNSEGNYHLELKDGYHTVVFRYVGYKTEVRPLTVSGKTNLDVTLKRVVFQLGEARVDGSEDPAYRIMRLARSRRKFYQKQVREYSCKVYVKGLNFVENLPKRILGRSLDVSGLDANRSGIIYLSESLSEFHFKAPDKTKERVIASKVSGNS